jgi:hypothetical protein
LSWEEVKFAILKVGFEIKNEEVVKSTYASEEKTLMEVIYNCIFFTAIKTENTNSLTENLEKHND